VLLLVGTWGTVGAADDPLAGAGTGTGLKVSASSEMSGYTDTDHVHVASPSIGAGVSDDLAGWTIGAHYLVDVVSAASVDIVSNASGKWSELRHVGSGSGSFKIDDTTVGASGVVSREPDYLSVTYGGTLSVDLLGKNVTPFVGFSYGSNDVGRTDLPHEFWRSMQSSNAQLGVTLVLGRSTIASFQWDGVFERGYLAKPYRYVPLFAAGTGASVPIGASVAEVNRQRLDERPAEQLPSARNRFALSGRLAHRFERATFRIDERLYADSWSMAATTTDARYMQDLGRRFTMWPHVRVHLQRQVSFYERAYEAIPGPGGSYGIPTYRTGDRELGPLYIVTLGLGTRVKLSGDTKSTWSLLFEMDGSHTGYRDALFLTERRAFFSTLALETEFE
jgi:hypothetical protein